MLGAVIVTAVFAVGYSLGYLRGHRHGVRQPLSARTAALRADVRRAENALGVTVPRMRSARYSRRTARR